VRRLLAELLNQLRREGFNSPYEPLYEHPIPLEGVSVPVSMNFVQCAFILDGRCWPSLVCFELLLSKSSSERAFFSSSFTCFSDKKVREMAFRPIDFGRRKREGIALIEEYDTYARILSEPFKLEEGRQAYSFAIRAEREPGSSKKDKRLLRLTILSAEDPA